MHRFLGLQEQIGGQLPIQFSDEVARHLLAGKSTIHSTANDQVGEDEPATVVGNPFATAQRRPRPITVKRRNTATATTAFGMLERRASLTQPRTSITRRQSVSPMPPSLTAAPGGVKVVPPHRNNVSFAKVVALESTIISHGMPYPENVQCAREVEAIVRAAGAIPATIAVLDGVIHVGLNDDQLEKLGRLGRQCAKVSRRDLPVILAKRLNGATTVSGTILIASMVGIDIMATGGVGGVHRGAESTMDISADLNELGRTRVLVVSAGIKSILDIPRTLEYLETQGVSVIGYQTTEFPSFYTRNSGCQAPLTLQSPTQVAQYLLALRRLRYSGGGILACPVPPEDEAKDVEAAITTALKECEAKGTKGRDITPFLLQRVAELTKGDSLRANIALVKNNARIAAQIAAAYFQTLKKMS